jgi:hypothetical protein
MVKCGVLFQVRTDFLYTVHKHSGFKGLIGNPLRLNFVNIQPAVNNYF